MKLIRTRVMKIFAWFSGLIITSFVVLFLHIYSVTHTPGKRNLDWHLTRVEFGQSPLDSMTFFKASSIMDTIPGVIDSYLNVEKGTLVYATKQGSFDADRIYRGLIHAGAFDAVKYVPEKNVRSGVSCPVMDKKSLSYQLGAFFQGVIEGIESKQ